MTQTPGDVVSLEGRIKAHAVRLGFDPVGITRLGPAQTFGAFAAWLDRGYAGEMGYLARGADKRRDTRLPYDGARAAIVVALDYGGKQPAGSVARYARGDDYHDVMLARLGELHRLIERECDREIRGKAYVDTGPILERDLAQRAGLGWIGKNTMLLSPRHGSFFFLGSLLLDLELEPDAPFEADRCGSCTRCLDACPTGAFVEPRVMDATRCISYLTIEHRSDVAQEMQPQIGNLLYGCDICQDVCPWNHKFASEIGDPALAPRPENVSPDPRELVSMTDEDFRQRFRGSPMKRAKRSGLARNAAIVLRNIEKLVAGVLVLVVIAGCSTATQASSASAQAPLAGSAPAPLMSMRDTIRNGYTAADVRYMQGMIAHHAQALMMTSLLPSRTSRADMKLLGERITVSQKDEIATMQRWLASRHEEVPDPEAHRFMMAGHMALMPGMLTDGELASLAKTTGVDFDRLFLQDMIRHHEGALAMVADLFAARGAGQETEIFRFASDVDADQRAEIRRMQTLRRDLQ